MALLQASSLSRPSSFGRAFRTGILIGVAFSGGTTNGARPPAILAVPVARTVDGVSTFGDAAPALDGRTALGTAATETLTGGTVCAVGFPTSGGRFSLAAVLSLGAFA